MGSPAPYVTSRSERGIVTISAVTDEPAPQIVSFRSRAVVEESTTCACYCCLARFSPASITEYVDGDLTPLCPRCGVDSVLASASYGGTLPDDEKLAAHRQQWFGDLKVNEDTGKRRCILDFFSAESVEEPPEGSSQP